jgi:hypothetical protein
MKWKLYGEKNHSGAAKPRISTIPKTKLFTRHSYSHTSEAVVIPLTLTQSPIVNASQPSLLLEGVFNEILYLRVFNEPIPYGIPSGPSTARLAISWAACVRTVSQVGLDASL